MEQLDEQLASKILDRVQNRKFTKFQLLGSLDDFIECGKYAKANKILIKHVKKSAKQLFKSYCKSVSLGTADLEELYAYTQLYEVIDFYNTDLKILQQMLNEYRDYLSHGNLIDALLGKERKL